MISNDFINLSCAVIVSDNTSFTQEIFENILDILIFYNSTDVPMQFKSKLQFANNIAKMRCAGKEPDEIFDAVSLHNQYEDLQDLIHHLREVNLSGEKVEKAISRIMNRYRVISTVKDIPILEEFIEKFHNGEIADSSEYVDSYEHLIGNIFKRVTETKRVSSHQRISTFDLSMDKFGPVLDQIEISYSGKNSITTGYRNLDLYMNGGFEPTRLYVFGGSSGDGKSCLLMNFVRNAIDRNKTHEEISGLKDIYIYVTLENSIDESLVRLWCSLTHQKISKVIKQFITERVNIENKMKQWQDTNNSTLVMTYFSPTSTSVSDISMYLKDIKDKYNGIGNIKGVYIDYMDLLKAGRTFDMYRLEMGHIALELKALSTHEQIPVITVSQLNRGAYDHKEHLSLAQMGESIKKVEHSDFVALIRSHKASEANQGNFGFKPPTNNTNGTMSVYIGKNRSGPKEKLITLKTNFEAFRIDDSNINNSIPFKDSEDLEIPIEVSL